MKQKTAVFSHLLLALVITLAIPLSFSSAAAQNAPANPASTVSTYLPVISNRTLLFATAVSAGSSYSCAVSSTDEAMCWGLNTYGQLGDGSQTTRFYAAPVSGLSSQVAAISAGRDHTCALMTTGGVKCWGYNVDGELGNSSYSNSNVPVDVTGLSANVKAISAGGSMTCALMTSGAVKCWGAIGAIASNTPVDFSLGGTVQEISAGSSHVCAVLMTTGGVKCWGANDKGQLGDGTTTPSPTAVIPTDLGLGVKAISAGFNHTCAALEAGGAMCWGDNSFGELGDNSTDPQLTPTPVSGISDVISQISAGKWFTCTLSAAEVSCWGNNNNGQLGDGTSDNRLIPAAVHGVTGTVTSISAGSAQACALLASGSSLCWGNNDSGQVGDGTYPYRVTPVKVSGLGNAPKDVRSGSSHTCAITGVDGAMCWGDNGNGQIGDNTSIQRLYPVNVFGPPPLGYLSPISQISPGGSHTCALTTASRVYCWGANDSGQLGVKGYVSSTAPATVPNYTSGVIAISSGFNHTCALVYAGGASGTGGVQCWGDNSLGQLGDGGAEPKSDIPVDVVVIDVLQNSSLLAGVTAISAGGNHTCALMVDETVMCWGENTNGQLGDGTTTTEVSAVAVTGLAEVAAISSGSSHTCALITGGVVDCWGLNADGQIGDGTNATRFNPVPVNGLTTATAISAGFAHTCAVLTGGSVQCWGANESGQLGTGTTVSSNTPVTVVVLPNGARVSSGRSHTCSLTTTHQVFCWGSNLNGQLGIGVSVNRYFPVEVVRR